MIKFSNITVSVPFVLLLSVMYLFDENNAFLPVVASIIIHEAAHIIALRMCGGRAEGIELKAFGIRINTPELKLMPYKAEIAIAAAGPIAGGITAAVFGVISLVFNVNYFDFFIGVNVIMSAINLLPIYPLDGGRIALSSCLLLLPLRFAKIIYFLLNITFSVLCVLVCLFLAIKKAMNPSLLIFAGYLAVRAVKNREIL